jgi:amino acid transporter
MNSASAQPERALGLTDVTLFMVTAGSTLQWTAVAAAIGPSSLIMWVVGGLAFFLPLSVCVVFLASRHPDEGGLFAWSARAFGPFTGFMAGWTYWSGTLAYLPAVLYFAAASARLASADSDAARMAPTWFIRFLARRARTRRGTEPAAPRARKVVKQRGSGCSLGGNTAPGDAGIRELVAIRVGDPDQSSYARTHVPSRRRHLLDDSRLLLDRSGGSVLHARRDP